MIKINNLCKTLGNKQVINNLNLSINDGSIFGLVGINGAGKSTLLRCISGVYSLDGGKILVDDKPVYENNDVKQNILFIADDPFINQNTTIKDLKILFSSFYEFSNEELYKYLNLFQVNISNKKLNSFSKGMKRRVMLSFALAIHPKYLLLDEAFDGLDPLGKLQFKKIVNELVEKYNMTVIIASHSLRELEAVCDSFAMMNNGNVVSSGDVDSSSHNIYKVQMAFKDDVNLEDFKEKEIINKNKSLHIVTLIVKANKDDIIKLFEHYNPLTIDIIDLTFEEMFIYETEAFNHE